MGRVPLSLRRARARKSAGLPPYERSEPDPGPDPDGEGNADVDVDVDVEADTDLLEFEELEPVVDADAIPDEGEAD